jgi:protein-L-isoaspartate(D-aspartate) O-methyltransferase
MSAVMPARPSPLRDEPPQGGHNLGRPKPAIDSQQTWRQPQAARVKLVQRLRAQGIADEAVLQAIASIPREKFIDEALRTRAYEDTALPIGAQQTISQPYVVARMAALMTGGKRLKNVLEIGTGCGYQAAVLSELADKVVSVERIKSLHELAKVNLRQLRLRTVHLVYGDGMLGVPSAAPFDGIIFAAAGLGIPDAVKQQLAVGGKLVAPVEAANGQQIIKVLERRVAGFIEKNYDEVRFVPLLGGMVKD